MARLLFLIIFLLTPILVFADSLVLPSDIDPIINKIQHRFDFTKIDKDATHVDVNDQSIIFNSKQKVLHKRPLNDGQPRTMEDDYFIVSTYFVRPVKTIVRRAHVSLGTDLDDMAWMRFVLDNNQKPFDQFFINRFNVPLQIYNRKEDMFVYFQAPIDGGAIEMKEWIYARSPNCARGSYYHWKMLSEQFNKRFVFEPNDTHTFNIKREVIVQGVDPKDYKKQRHAIETINKVSQNKWYISGEDIIGQVEPVQYITREGKHKRAVLIASNHNELDIQINEPQSAYPILIESN